MLRLAQHLCTVTGAALILAAAVAFLDGTLASRSALAAFEEAAAGTPAAGSSELAMLANQPDQELWSAKRKTRYAKSLDEDLGLPEAVLSVPSLGLEVPVFPGTGRVVLNRGAGRLEDTAAPGTAGNIAIAGHRDGFFRPLKDIEVGAVLALRTLGGTQRFEVSEILIVDPLDLSVLDPSNEAMLTLITCYPFYYVGYAPDRYIVRARLVGLGPASRQKREI
ncbi:MAG: class D sortase [Gammaproteobacteria bacterium]|nr:class D sortase [Gammaproteobacteria bacterium]